MPGKVCMEGSRAEAGEHVLLVADDGAAGGVGRYCVDLAEALRPRVSLVCLCSEDCMTPAFCWLAEQCRARELRLVSIRMPAKGWMQGFKGFSDVWKQEGRPVVHTNGRRGNFLATLARQRYDDFHFVTTVHGVLGLHARRNAAYRLVDLAASRAADAVIAVSVDTARRLASAGVSPRKILVVANGLAEDTLARLTPAATTRPPISCSAGAAMGFLGRLSAEKGFEEFIELAARLSARMPEVTFVVAGDGNLRSRFLERSAHLRASGRLEYLGEVADPAVMLGHLDILVMPSHNEGLPYVLLEAMAAGCAIAAYGVGGIPEVVVDRSVGYLVRPHDFESLLDGVTRLASDRAWTRTMGLHASLHVAERYSLSRRIPSLLYAYERCSTERAARSAADTASRT